MRKIDAEIERLEKHLDNVIGDTHCYVRSTQKQQLETLKSKRSKIRFYQNPALATLTFKTEPSVEVVSDRFHRFIDDLSKSVFKMTFRRYRKLVMCSAAYERNKHTQTRMNIHASFDRPVFLTESDFCRRIRKHWKWGYVKFQDTTSYYTEDPSDYVNYSFKEKTKDLGVQSYASYFLM